MKTLQLQFFNHASRAYVPSAHQGDMTPDNARAVACGRAWRIASPDRALKPTYRAPRRNSHSRTVEDIQVAYVEWAKAQGLQHITIYREHAGKVAFARWYGARTYITEAEQFAVTKSHEVKSGAPAHLGA